ncbi:MAG: lipoprotein [Rhodanobacter sp.]|jgi:predicted small lipoprotein YifL|nr:lipoprotein [Rhodanobacter sp.]
MSSRLFRPIAVLALVALVALVAACGNKGPLVKPPPQLAKSTTHSPAAMPNPNNH